MVAEMIGAGNYGSARKLMLKTDRQRTEPHRYIRRTAKATGGELT